MAAGIARVYATTAGTAALRRAAPLGCGILLFSAIAFGPTGLQAADVLRVVGGSPPARLVLWGGWTLLASGPVRALFDTPSAWVLRWLPISRSTHAALVAAALVVIASPWVALWAVGRGPLAGAAAGLAAAALGLAVAARPSKPIEIAAAAAVALAVAFDVTPLVLAPIALGAAVPLFSGAFARAPERDAASSQLVRVASPAVALARAIGASMLRAERPTLLRGLAFAIVGGAVAGLVVRNGGVADATGTIEAALVATALPLAIAAAGASRASVDAERSLGWLLDATATPPRIRVWARLAMPALATAADALAAGVVTVALAPISIAARAVVLVAVGGWGVAIATAVAAMTRGAERSDGVDGAGVLVRALGAAAAAASLATAGGPRALPLVAGGAAALVALDLRRAAVPGRA